MEDGKGQRMSDPHCEDWETCKRYTDCQKKTMPRPKTIMYRVKEDMRVVNVLLHAVRALLYRYAPAVIRCGTALTAYIGTAMRYDISVTAYISVVQGAPSFALRRAASAGVLLCISACGWLASTRIDRSTGYSLWCIHAPGRKPKKLTSSRPQ